MDTKSIEKIAPAEFTSAQTNNDMQKNANAPSSDSIEYKNSTAFDQATGILQAIISNKLTDEVIRKIPADEYVKMISILDDMLRGSVDKKV